MANTIKIKRGSGSDPAASDMVLGEPVLRTDTAELFFKKDDGSVAKVSGGGGGPDFKYLELRNAANNGAASYPANDFTLVTSGTTNAITPAAANTLLVSVNGVIQKPNAGTSTSGITGFIVDGSRFKTATNLTAAPEFILYQESGGIGEPSDNTVDEAKLKVSNSPVNGYFLSAQSGNTGGLTWAAPVATSCTGNSATATALATARTINGTSFDGTANITVTAAAGTLTGNTLNSSVTASSLTSLGDLSGLTVNGDMSLTGANYNVLWDKSDNALEFADNAEAKFGVGSDLQIYHDGSNSYIKNNTGILYLQTSSSGGVTFRTQSGTDTWKVTAGGNFEPSFNNFFDIGSSSARVKEIHVNTAIDLIDNAKLKLGTGDDLQIYHDGGDSVINNNGGNLYINAKTGETAIRINRDADVQLYYDGTKKFETISDGAKVTGRLQVTNYLEFDDDVEAYWGNSHDLQIWHDGTHSRLKSTTGMFNIQSDDFRVTDAANSLTAFKIDPDGATDLRHNGSVKLQTTSAGVDVTGNLTFAGDSNTHISHPQADYLKITTGGNEVMSFTNASNIFVPDSRKLMFGDHVDLQLYHNGTENIITTNNSAVLQIRCNGTEKAIEVNPDGNVELYYDNVKKFETTSTGVSIPSDTTFLQIGAGQDLDLHHNGTNSYIRNKTGDLHIRPLVAEEGIILKPNGGVHSYYNNVLKTETTNSGLRVHGHIDIEDNDKLRVGHGDDLEIYHDGNHSYIQDAGTGNLIMKSNVFRLRGTNDEEMIIANENGNVQLYYDGSKKLETTSAGATVTGTLTADGITVGDAERIKLGSSDDLELFHTGTETFIKNSTGTLNINNDGVTQIKNYADNEFIAKFTSDAGVELYYDNNKKLETISTGVAVTGNVFTNSIISNTATNDDNTSNVVIKARNAAGGSGDYFAVGVAGNVYQGKEASSFQNNPAGNNTIATTLRFDGGVNSNTDGQYHRLGRNGDGSIVGFFSAGGLEGSINISGTSTTLVGGNLSRWSQIKGLSQTDKSDRPTIYQGTVMSNLDDLCVWEGEDNQQLNMTKISDVEEDKDVAGIFFSWDDDDDKIVNDFYVAMTGDMVIRVAASTTVARGDLMISAGDGTAKPQADDIIRSSTIAKIISTNHTATYPDGSKAYPCVLMAC